ncbi:uncharacterized protein CBL_13564 [Carabus blaptoides fortunei]
MSDEERARYLQHRAAIEEEAKRRKEQLIATYMKNKLKREEAFTRLNIAKINEYWHQILRKIKVKELKTEIQDLSVWITKVIGIKNSIIKRLMDEIEEAEDQYEYNLESYLSSLDSFIDLHFQRQDELQQNFEDHKESMLEEGMSEINELNNEADEEEQYLRTVLYTMEKNFNDMQNKLKTYRESKLQDYSNTMKAEQETMVKSYSMKMDKIWKDINSTLTEYLARTTVRRHHYIELKHLDDRNSAERADNERRIARYTEKLNSYKTEYKSLRESNEKQIEILQNLKKNLITQYRDLKQHVAKTNKKDEQILAFMTVTSNNAIKEIEQLVEKGNSVMQLVKCCQKLETEEDKLMFWAKFHKKLNMFEESIEEEEVTNITQNEHGKPEEESTEETQSDGSKDEEAAQSEPDAPIETDIPEGFEVLEKVNGVWWCYNRVVIECMQMKQEKESLIAENKNLKDIIKGILKDAALQPKAPPKHMTYPVQSKIMSAPISRQRCNSKQQLSFVVIDL